MQSLGNLGVIREIIKGGIAVALAVNKAYAP